MNNKKTVRSIIILSVSNLIKLLSSILMGLVLPVLLDVQEYGYYKLFILYFAYIGLLNFGFIDGIYLKYGGFEYNTLSKEKFRTYTKHLFRISLIGSTAVSVYAICFLTRDKSIVFLFLAINIIAVTLTSYFQFISQITKRFREFSIRTVIQSLSNAIIILIIYVTNQTNYIFLLSLVSVTNYLMLIWYCITYRDLILGRREKISLRSIELLTIFKLGIPLLAANFIAMFLQSIDKFFIEFFFSIETFAIYSFAGSMIGLCVVFVNSIGVVLYPYLKATDITTIRDNYPKVLSIVLIVLSASLLAFFPLCLIINQFLSKYINSIPIYRIAFPCFILTSACTIVKHNFIKIENKNSIYFLIGLSMLVISIPTSLIVHFIFNNPISLTIVSLIVAFVWYIVIEMYFILKFKVKYLKNLSYVSLMIFLFLLVTLVQNYYLGFILYFISFLLITLLYFLKNHKELINIKI